MHNPYSSSTSVATKPANFQLAHLYKRLAQITEKAQQEHAAKRFETFVTETQRLTDLVAKLSRLFQYTPDMPVDYQSTAHAWEKHFAYLLILINQFKVDPTETNACKLRDYFISMHTTWLELTPGEARGNTLEPITNTPQPVTLTL